MKTLDEQMSFYLRYHRNPKNRLTHFIGVPLIMFSLFVLLGMIKLVIAGFAISAATILAVAVLVYYFRLDIALAMAMTLFTAVLLLVANRVVDQGAVPALVVFAVTFVGGWVLQLIGHVFEGKRPALVDNLFQVIIAPIFLMAEVFFALGYKRDVAARIEQRAAQAEQS